MKNDNKTKPTNQDIVDFVAGLPQNRQEDTEKLVQIMQDVSGQAPVLWGDRIIGFGRYHYTYPSGREGDWMQIGFAPGKAAISLYLTYDAEKLTGEIEGLGKFKTGKGCIYLNKLADVDQKKLRQLVKTAYDAGNPFQ